MKELGMKMYQKSFKEGDEGKAQAEQNIRELEKKYPQEIEFWESMRTYSVVTIQ